MFGSDEKADCPLWRAKCKEHKCRWYLQIMGVNPNDGQPVNKFGCAIEFLPMLLIENSQQTRQAGASIDRFNNDMMRAQSAAVMGVPLLMRDDKPPPTSLPPATPAAVGALPPAVPIPPDSAAGS